MRTSHRCVIVLTAALFAYLSAAQTTTPAKSPLSVAQAVSVRRLRELRWSPDGSRLVLTVTEPPKGADSQKHIWIFLPNSRELRQFTSSSKTESHPRWSPDGKQVAFLSDRDEFQQIYVMPADGGEAIRRTEGKRRIEAFEWSPDGKQIAFLASQAKTEDEEKKEKDKEDARLVDRDDKRAHLWIMDTESWKPRELVGAPWQFHELQWAPRSDRLIVVATDHPESDQETDRIFSVNLADVKMQPLAAPHGPFDDMRISPDGKWISYVGSRVDGPVPHDLYLLPIDGGTPHNLTAQSLDRPVEAYVWRPDGKLLALIGEGFRNRFAVVDTSGHAQPLLDPQISIRDFDESAQVARAFLPANAGTPLAFAGESMARPAELFLWDGKSSPTPVSHFNQSFNNVTLATPEFVRYKTFDGRPIEGALLLPTASTSNSKLPTVLLIHGGPTGNWNDAFESWGQLLANAGYAVFYPNVRGSTGYGYDFMVLNRGDWGGGDFLDVIAAADYLVQRGIADPYRLGIAGWSYGGYMAEWAITQTNRFKAAVSGAGMSNLATEFGTEDHPSYDEWFYGLPYEKQEGFLHSSPITYVKNARTPTLILQGQDDVIDPPGQSQELYRALKRYGVETELVIYPREGHGLKEEKHLIDRLQRTVRWFDKHLKP
jgi:dipeptidyl aminopeptidase/acylaminoacyl peptidase